MNNVLVDKELHKNTKVVTALSKDDTDLVHFVDIVVPEFRNLLAYYPIIFAKDAATGDFICVTIFGFEPGENLFLANDAWDYHYLPIGIRRRPFQIQMVNVSGEEESNGPVPAITVDMDDERVQEETGEALFEANGESSKYFDGIRDLLARWVDGVRISKGFIARMQELDLIKEFDFNVNFADGTAVSLNGLYFIDEEKFRSLDSTVTLELHESGYLECVYMMLASMNQFEGLVKLKNQLLTADKKDAS